MIDIYLVDTVTLSRMTAAQRASVFVRNCCRIPEEILFEAQGLPDIDVLKQRAYPVTTAVLEKVKVVMATINPNDRVIDLYRNKGNGDVMLLATALAEMDVSAGQLIGDRWIIATGDEGLTKKAADMGVLTCTPRELIELTSSAA